MAESEPRVLVDVFVAGEDGYHTYRIPAVVMAANGDLLAFAEGRVHGSGDAGDIDMVMKRSTNGGATWGDLQVVGDFGDGGFANPAPVVDAASGDVLLLAVLEEAGSHEADIRNSRGGGRVPCAVRSSDHGETWGEVVSLAETCDRADWRWYATGPCHAIQLQRGEHAGRLVVPANFSQAGGGGNDYLGAHALLSDDGGATWRIGAVDNTHIGENEFNPNESTVVELSDGRLLFNTRDQGGTSRATRGVTVSEDGGASFVSPYAPEEALVAPVCQASLLGVDTEAGRLLVFSAPGVWDARRRMHLRVSADDGATWRDGPVLYEAAAAYSDMVALDADTIGCLFEADGYRRIVFTPVALTELAGDNEPVPQP
ncbi:sialidase family protein [Phycisphaeraceae bacterium D3-23]